MKSRYLAGASLALMACGFIVTLFLPESAWVQLLRGGFEAGLVGGVADWFAVTALFRHPFGIPIPHTSLLLRNKDRIVQSLVSALENELLNKQSIENKLRKLPILRGAGSFLTGMLRKRSVRIDVLEFAIGLLRKLQVERAVPHVQVALAAFIRRMDAKAAAESAVTKLIQSGYEEKAFDYAIRGALDWVGRPETRLMLGKLAIGKISEVKASGFTGFAIQAFAGFMSEDKLGQMLQDMLLSAGRDLLDPEDANRGQIVQEIRVRLFGLAEDEERLERLKLWAADLAEGPEGASFLQARLEELRDALVDKLEGNRASGGPMVFSAYRTIARSLSRDPETMETIEHRVRTYAIDFVEANHYRIGQLVKENVDQMDDASLVRMLEDKIGKDLQWIRVNGAICGFIVGLALSAIQQLA
ncbi:DUF445 domain-containing protein [Cohnella candidum]|uniref:DUF445 domain-containing protein n=1 Tax=Cohnella candidum TaxID=2674991 RepID=A0A3G3JTL6_9BACL|nr:DUF445 domain-containing protein [Cohnella candidum]AYQ71161.1 DUF445 domain-containing protein [Cohnella candidum]